MASPTALQRLLPRSGAAPCCPAGTQSCGDSIGAADLAFELAADDRKTGVGSGNPVGRPRKEPAALSPQPRAGSSDNRAECQRILQRQSLGETSAELIERANALGCR